MGLNLLIKSLLAVFYILIQTHYIQKIENATDEIEFQDEKKTKIYKAVHFLYGINTCTVLIVLAMLVLA